MKTVIGGLWSVIGQGRKALWVLLILTGHWPLATDHSYAANDKAGTAGAAFLKVGAGARPAGMGEAYTGLADDVNAVGWNAAGLGRMGGAEFTAMQGQWIAGMDYNFMAAAYPTGYGTFGLGMRTLAVGEIERRGTDVEAAEGEFEGRDAAYTMSYGVEIARELYVGVGASYIRQELDNKVGTGISGEAGVMWQLPFRPLMVGMTVRNMGSKIKYEEEADKLPMTTSVGIGYSGFGERLKVGVDARRGVDQEMPIGAGAEWEQRLPWEMAGAIRAGYTSTSAEVEDGSGMSVGMGLKWRQWGFDMAWVPYGVLGQTFRYALVVKF